MAVLHRIYCILDLFLLTKITEITARISKQNLLFLTMDFYKLLNTIMSSQCHWQTKAKTKLSNVLRVMSIKQIKAHYKYSQVIIHVQTACEPHDLTMFFFCSFDNDFKLLYSGLQIKACN